MHLANSTDDLQEEPPQQQQQQGGEAGMADISAFRDSIVNALREWYVLATDSISSLLEGRGVIPETANELWLLGRYYELGKRDDGVSTTGGEEEEAPALVHGYPAEVVKDFSRLIWCTYRSQYPPIAESGLTTDAGWGCMLRAGQTLVAQALQLHFFGREWGFSWSSQDSQNVQRQKQYRDIVKQFMDNYSESSLFSIHRMAGLGRRLAGKDIGEWFGPHGTATVIRELAQQADHDMSVYTTADGIVYLADICKEGGFRPTLILATSMLGTDRVNPIYYPFIQASLTLPQSAGIAGGRPSSAMYFAGFQGDELLYLDPHHTRPTVIPQSDGEYSQSDLESYSCSTPRRISLSRLDPCMVFGFYCGTLESLVDLRSRIEMLATDGIWTAIYFEDGHAPTVEEVAAIVSPDDNQTISISSSNGSDADEWVTDL